MNKLGVYALTMDGRWGEMLTQIVDESFEITVMHCPEGYPDCLENLPEADPDALLLVDATGLPDVAGMVRRLRRRGWRHVVVIAADPTAKEANAAFKAGASDYGTKTLDRRTVLWQLGEWVRQVQSADAVSGCQGPNGVALRRGPRDLSRLEVSTYAKARDSVGR